MDRKPPTKKWEVFCLVAVEPAFLAGLALANHSILKTGKAKAVRFSTLEAICEALDCQPGDILEHVPDQ